MARETTYAGKLGQLMRFTTALGANSPDLAHLEGPRARLAKILEDAQETAKQQAALTASKQEASKKLRAMLNEAERLATGMSRFLTEHYGVRSEKLAEFGMQPFRGRKVAKAETPVKPEPPAEPAAPSKTNL